MEYLAIENHCCMRRWLCRFFRTCGLQLTCLRMACCRFVDGSLLASVANNCPHLEGLS